MKISDIEIQKRKSPLPKPEAMKDGKKLGFGSYFTDHMFLMEYRQGTWQNPRIVPFADLPISPAAVVLHYAQTIFEGQKAYAWKDGRIALFRPMKNIERLNKSAKRLCMPEVDKEFVMGAMKELIKIDKDWIPPFKDCSLYIRPTMIGISPKLGVAPSVDYLFYIILSPVSGYFEKGLSPVRIMISRHYVRAVKGGMGDAKTGGNYATSLLAGKQGKEKGCDQVLWLDAKDNKYIEEMGGMNVFFVIDDILTTSPLTGTILPGVTRDSIIHLAKEKGWEVEERPFTIDEVIAGIKSGKVKEAFASGTAAVVTPIKELLEEDGTVYKIPSEMGPKAQELYKELTDIQYGLTEDKYSWIEFIK